MWAYIPYLYNYVDSFVLVSVYLAVLVLTSGILYDLGRLCGLKAVSETPGLAARVAACGCSQSPAPHDAHDTNLMLVEVVTCATWRSYCQSECLDACIGRVLVGTTELEQEKLFWPTGLQDVRHEERNNSIVYSKKAGQYM